MLCAGRGLPPFWSSLTPAQLATWTQQHLLPFATTLVPLSEIAFVFGLSSLLVHLSPTEKSRPWTLLAGICLFCAVITYFLGTVPVQDVLGRGSVPDAVLTQIIGRWAISHWIQFTLEFVAFLASLRALSFACSGITAES